MRILYFEDEINSHLLMVTSLGIILSGAEITVTTSGEEALEKL